MLKKLDRRGWKCGPRFLEPNGDGLIPLLSQRAMALNAIRIFRNLNTCLNFDTTFGPYRSSGKVRHTQTTQMEKHFNFTLHVSLNVSSHVLREKLSVTHRCTSSQITGNTINVVNHATPEPKLWVQTLWRSGNQFFKHVCGGYQITVSSVILGETENFEASFCMKMKVKLLILISSICFGR